MTALPSIDPAAVASVAALVTVIVQVILTAGNIVPPASTRWGPLLALAVGIVVAEAGMVALGPVTAAAVSTALFVGLAGGLSAMGVQNIVTKSAVGTVVSSAIGVQRKP
jgi:hypothetical protein